MSCISCHWFCYVSAHDQLSDTLIEPFINTYNMDQGTTCYTRRHTYNIMHTALMDMICTLLQCHVCTCEPASVVEQLVKGQRSHPTLKPHMHNSLNHSLPLTVCMALTLFLCRKSAPKVSHSSCTRSLWPLKAASWTAVLPSWERGIKRKVHQMCAARWDQGVREFSKKYKVVTEPHWACAVIWVTS